MFTNELKKGTRVKLRNGWFATLEDNARGNIRLATVEGYVTEIGSIYSHDIKYYYDKENGWVCPEYTSAQLKLRKQVGYLMG